ncbi:MAG: MOSC domain-containing protein [Pseudonocardiales bacterium]
MTGQVIAVSRDGAHRFSKAPVEVIRLIEGLGLESDAHAGVTVQHLSRMRRDPTQPNLRQVHLVHAELHVELAGRGFTVTPGDMGENVTTHGIDLLGLPTGTQLGLGTEAVIELTGLRNPCVQLDRFAKGLMAAVLDRAADGSLIRKAGVMSIVIAGGEVRAGDPIAVVLPSGRHRPLEPV